MMAASARIHFYWLIHLSVCIIGGINLSEEQTVILLFSQAAAGGSLLNQQWEKTTRKFPSP
jgi:hypothetical protein